MLFTCFLSIELSTSTINKLLTALNECTEWGQVFILDSLSNYTPKDEREAQSICERITPRLAHANAAVVLSAVKVLIKMMEILAGDTEFCSTLSKKLAPPLVTLLSSEPEVQYVALRNINLIVQKKPDILKHEMKVIFVYSYVYFRGLQFFCRYSLSSITIRSMLNWKSLIL